LTGRRLTTLLLVVGIAPGPVAGCGSTDQVERTARTSRSWDATVRSTSEALASGAVPRLYARQVLQAALESRRQLAEKPEWPLLPENTRRRFEDSIRHLAASLDGRGDSVPSP
jgi:hypothetical protein